ncbi:MAG: ATP12 family protein [Pseudomonadota bacterium]
MSEWAVKRFWTDSAVEETADGFAVTLDGRSVRTPLKAPLVLPTEPLARAVAGEWAAQGEHIDPTTMPVTRSTNAAIDKVTVQRDDVIAMLAEYGATDLLCYRAEGPDALTDAQAAGWDPVLDWAAEQHGARLFPVSGVMYQPQPEESLAALRARMDRMDAFALTGFHDLVTLSGSLVLGLAVYERHMGADAAWPLTRIDEDYQERLWGTDEEAAEAAALKRTDFLHAARFVALSRGEADA